MVANSSGCDPARIKLLLEDRLTSDGQTELEQHLETCIECRQRLESQAADAGWWKEAREFLGPTASSGPPISVQAVERVLPRKAAPGDEEDAAELPPGLLHPSDDPAMLGRLGPYEIVEVLGRGGMGIVLKGFEPQLSRYVAIKVLAPHLAASGAARQRFTREAKSAAAVVHEHVIAIHSIQAESGLPYLVMPLIAGESLQQRMDRAGPFELKEILRIGAQVAEGLAAAHAHGLVHRDIKPANILLENGVERVKITDFGLARAIDDATVTHSGFLAGTPQYMAPEQARGEMIDHRCDLFSLGSVLYAMCTGHSPFRAETTMAVLRRVCEENPTPVRQGNADIPGWLAEIIDKLHAKDPAERFQSAAEVADLLSRHLAHCQQPWAMPMPPPLRYRSPAARAARRRRYWIAAVGLLVLALGASVAGIVHWAAQTGGARGTPTAVRGAPDSTAVRGSPDRSAVRGSPDPAQAATEGLQKWPGRPAVDSPAGSETRAERDSRTERMASAEEETTGWDPLPGEILRVDRDLGQLETQWRRSAVNAATPVPDPLSEIRARLDNLEKHLQADGP